MVSKMIDERWFNREAEQEMAHEQNCIERCSGKMNPNGYCDCGYHYEPFWVHAISKEDEEIMLIEVKPHQRMPEHCVMDCSKCQNICPQQQRRFDGVE